jgi:TPP-dependent pyruvate/acetoin dehydrogenase alpha subunit
MFDPELYRSKAEVEEWKKRCPIDGLKSHLLDTGLIDTNDLEAMEKAVDEEIREAVTFAENGTWEPVGDLTRFVLSEGRTP